MPYHHYLPREVPASLSDLVTLALDMRWSWHHGADDLWRRVDPELWDVTANPWLILESVSGQRLLELSTDKQFLQALQQQITARDEHFQAETWFAATYGSRFRGQIAYFSMEFGLSESLPIYSGGLGILAGDHLKTASDMGIPMVGVGLLVSSLSMTMQQGLLGSFVFIMPAVTLSGFATPVENMPHWLQVADLINPLRYIIVALRDIFLEGADVTMIWPQLWPLMLLACITLPLASWLFRHRSQ